MCGKVVPIGDVYGSDTFDELMTKLKRSRGKLRKESLVDGWEG